MTLPYSPVDPHSPIPLYHQIYLDLHQMIQQQIIPPGGMLPPEIEICQAYGVGRQTVRQAIARLVDEDLVERFAGRGTFVRSLPRHTQFFLNRSFSQQMRELGLIPNSKLIRIDAGAVNADHIAVLRNRKGASCVTIERLRLGNDEPICHQVSTVLSERCPGIEQQDFEHKSLYEILATHYHLNVTRFDLVVRSVAADEYRAELLGVTEETPLLYVGTTAYTDDDEVVEFSMSYYRADRYEFTSTQTCCDK